MIDTSELEASCADAAAYVAALEEVGRHLPPDTRISAQGAKLAGVELRELASVRTHSLNNPGSRRRDSNSRGSSSSANHSSGSSSSGSGVGVVRAWLSHVSRPLLALGPTDAVFVWRCPHSAERELRRRLEAHAHAAAASAASVASAAAAAGGYGGAPEGGDGGGGTGAGEGKDGESGGQGFSRGGGGAVMWTADAASESLVERARLLYHLGVCLRQQLAGLASRAAGTSDGSSGKGSASDGGGSDDGGSDESDSGRGWAGAATRGRLELALAAAEALGRAHELGHASADGELEALRRDVAGEDYAVAGGEVARSGDVRGNRDGNARHSSGGAFGADAGANDRSAAAAAGPSPEDSDSDAATARLLARVALVTLSNSGYADYTLNAMVSLRVHCRLACALQVR